MSQRYLYVGRLDKDVTQRDLEELFESYGRFTKCDIRSGAEMGEFVTKLPFVDLA